MNKFIALIAIMVAMLVQLIPSVSMAASYSKVNRNSKEIASLTSDQAVVIAAANQTITASSNAVVSANEVIATVGSTMTSSNVTASTTNTVLDCSSTSGWEVTLTTNTTIRLTNLPAGCPTIKLLLIQDSTGTRTVSIDGAKWPGASAYVATTNATAKDVVILTTYDRGTNLLGLVSYKYIR